MNEINYENEISEEWKQIDNENEIREAWFLFRRDQIGLSRFAFWLVIWIFSIAIVKQDSIKSLTNAYLIFTLSLFMEFAPHFSKYQIEATNENNRKLLQQKKTISAFFLVFLVVIALLSACGTFEVLALSNSILNVFNNCYLIVYVICFLYLFCNCISGMCYVPRCENRIVQTKKMYSAAEEGPLGKAQPNK